MNPTIEHAYATACRRLGEAEVELAVLREELMQVTSELETAGARIVELVAERAVPVDHSQC